MTGIFALVRNIIGQDDCSTQCFGPDHELARCQVLIIGPKGRKHHQIAFLCDSSLIRIVSFDLPIKLESL